MLLKSPVLLEEELKSVVEGSGLANTTFSLHYKTGHPDAMAEVLAVLAPRLQLQHMRDGSFHQWQHTHNRGSHTIQLPCAHAGSSWCAGELFGLPMPMATSRVPWASV